MTDSALSFLESLLGLFIDSSDMAIKTEVTVYNKIKYLKLPTCSAVLPCMEVEFSKVSGVFDVLMISYFVLSMFSWR